VINVVLDQGTTEDMESFINDTLQHGCQSGIVTELITYNDTVEFYHKYQSEINDMLVEMLQSVGSESPSDLFGDKWDSEDPFANDIHNQNLLAWFGFEETLRQIADQLELEY